MSSTKETKKFPRVDVIPTKETKKFPRVRRSMAPPPEAPSVRPKTPSQSQSQSQSQSKPPLSKSPAERQAERMADRLSEAEDELARERKARATESDLMGMMLVRVAQAEERAKQAQDALEAHRRLPPPPSAAEDVRRIEELTARVSELEADLEGTRKRLSASPSDALRDAEKRLEDLTARHKKTLENAGKLSTGLDEMRALMGDCAGIYEELERREMAIAGIRARSLHDAKALLRRAASGEAGPERMTPPPLPQVLDVSEVAELIESMRPPSIDEITRGAEAISEPAGAS